MKRIALLGLLLVTVASSEALNITEWEHRQKLEVTAADGRLIKVALPTATLALARRPFWSDFRLLDVAGREVPFVISYYSFFYNRTDTSARNFKVRSTPDTTEIRIEPDASIPLESVGLKTLAPTFLKFAKVEVSDDGLAWQLVGAGHYLFRQDGAEQLSLPLLGQVARHIRITVDDATTPPVKFNSCELLGLSVIGPEVEETSAQLLRREEYAGRTVLTMAVGAAGLPIHRAEYTISDPSFVRRAGSFIQAMRDNALTDVNSDWAAIYRLPGLSGGSREQLSGPAILIKSRILSLHINNENNPPLEIEKVRLFRSPVWLYFAPTQNGTYTLLAGNRSDQAPPQSIPSLPLARAEPRIIPSGAVALQPAEPNPDYVPERPGGGLSPVPSSFDPIGWAFRKSVSYGGSGVMQLELDPAVLARSKSNYADIRLVQAGRVIPCLVERPLLFRQLPSELKAMAKDDNATVSRWEINLPQPDSPIRRLVLTLSTGFNADVHVYEMTADAGGLSTPRTLARATWRLPMERGSSGTDDYRLTIDLATPASQRTLWIEVINHDSAPITLDAVAAFYPVVRLVFKAAEGGQPFLYYGRADAAAPVFDLIVDPEEMLAAERKTALLGLEEPASGIDPSGALSLKKLFAGLSFWTMLGLAVGVLGLMAALVVVVRRS